jgi:hypothetical protein
MVYLIVIRDTAIGFKMIKKLPCNYGFAEFFYENCFDAKVFPFIFKLELLTILNRNGPLR